MSNMLANKFSCDNYYGREIPDVGEIVKGFIDSYENGFYKVILCEYSGIVARLHSTSLEQILNGFVNNTNRQKYISLLRHLKNHSQKIMPTELIFKVSSTEKTRNATIIELDGENQNNDANLAHFDLNKQLNSFFNHYAKIIGMKPLFFKENFVWKFTLKQCISLNLSFSNPSDDLKVNMSQIFTSWKKLNLSQNREAIENPELFNSFMSLPPSIESGRVQHFYDEYKNKILGLTTYIFHFNVEKKGKSQNDDFGEMEGVEVIKYVLVSLKNLMRTKFGDKINMYIERTPCYYVEISNVSSFDAENILRYFKENMDELAQKTGVEYGEPSGVYIKNEENIRTSKNNTYGSIIKSNPESENIEDLEKMEKQAREEAYKKLHRKLDNKLADELKENSSKHKKYENDDE